MRVLSIHPAATELLFAIGAGAFVVGRTDACDYPAQAKKLPSLGDEISEVVIAVFEPELILAGPGQEELARALGEKYKVILFAPESLDGLYREIAVLGELLGKQVEADMVVHELRTLLDKLKEKAGKYKKIRVYCEVAPTQTTNGYVKELLTIAGAEPFTGEVTVERLQSFNPQVIFSCVPNKEETSLELITSRDGWQQLNAIKFDRIFSIPGWMLHRPGPRMQEGVRKVARLLHGVEL